MKVNENVAAVAATTREIVTILATVRSQHSGGGGGTAQLTPARQVDGR